MGDILSPKPVLPLLAVTSRHDDALQWSARRLVDAFGPLQKTSPPFRFDQTDYYAATMGTELKKQFLCPARLMDPADLSDWKIATNDWEASYQAQSDHPESRPLNLDPGYISEDKLVLASTKNHAHRIYLQRGIYAEVTLQFRSRQWQTCPWTYPDYTQPSFHEFFLECRSYLRQALRAPESS